MDSHGTVISLLNHRTFSERQLARVDHAVLAKIGHNRLYISILTSGKVPREVLLSMRCSAFGKERVYASAVKVEDVIEAAGHLILVSAVIASHVGYDGDIPSSATIILQANKAEKAFSLGVVSAVQP